MYDRQRATDYRHAQLVTKGNRFKSPYKARFPKVKKGT